MPTNSRHCSPSASQWSRAGVEELPAAQVEVPDAKVRSVRDAQGFPEGREQLLLDVVEDARHAWAGAMLRRPRRRARPRLLPEPAPLPGLDGWRPRKVGATRRGWGPVWVPRRHQARSTIALSFSTARRYWSYTVLTERPSTAAIAGNARVVRRPPLEHLGLPPPSVPGSRSKRSPELAVPRRLLRIGHGAGRFVHLDAPRDRRPPRLRPEVLPGDVSGHAAEVALGVVQRPRAFPVCATCFSYRRHSTSSPFCRRSFADSRAPSLRRAITRPSSSRINPPHFASTESRTAFRAAVHRGSSATLGPSSRASMSPSGNTSASADRPG